MNTEESCEERELPPPLHTAPACLKAMELCGTWISERLRSQYGPGAPPFPRELLPRTGLACLTAAGRPVAVACVYLERSSPVAVCGWLAADPENPPELSARAVDLLLTDLPGFAARSGARHLMTFFGSRSLNRLLPAHGFTLLEKSENHYHTT